MSGARQGRSRWLAPALSLGALAVALAALGRELRAFRYHDVAHAVRVFPGSQLAAALVLTAVSYAVLVGYDALALRYVGRTLPARRVAFASFVSYGLSHTLGFAVLTGGAARVRFWSLWGMSTEEIAQAVSFAGGTFLLGMVETAGIVLVVEPDEATALLHVPGIARPLGILCLLAVGGYVAWSAARGARPVRVGGWEFPVPRAPLALLQVALVAIDWLVAAAVLWVLLPAGSPVPFLPFVGAFVLGQFAGLVSHVPGGLGVFDTVLVVALRRYVPNAAAVLASLVVYRMAYYVVPFAAAIGALVVHETRGARARLAGTVARGTRFVGRVAPRIVPVALSVATFAAGSVLLASGATPSVHSRVAVLHRALPLGLIEVSHFASSLAGAALLVLAWALRRRLDAAWGLAVAALSIGVVGSLLKGLDWEEALLLLGVLALLVPSRRAFYRRAALTSEPFTPGWLVAVAVVVGVTAWLGFFSFKHVEYSHDLWWRFESRGDAPRFLRATVGVLVGLGVFALQRLLRPMPHDPVEPDAAALDRAQAIVQAAGTSEANVALLGDKALLFSESGRTFVMYGVSGRSWIALGDPVGPPSEHAEVAWRFKEAADAHAGWTVFYQVSAVHLPLYIDLGLTLLKLGEEAHVALDRFSLDGAARKGMRRVVNAMEKQGVRFEVREPDAAAPLLPALRRISDDWLTHKRVREKRFSIGCFDERYLARLPIAVVWARDGDGERPVAFANVWRGGTRELSVDLMRYADDAPDNVMEYLFVQLMLWGKAQGFADFNLGMAPLSGFESRHVAPLWSRAGALVYQHGEALYNFRGLRGYKEKFDPEWRPKYLASPGGLVLPRVLANVTTLISGGLRGVIAR